MKRIAVWGYGVYGKHMVESIEIYWSDVIKVIRIYDRELPLKETTDTRFSSPEIILEDYKKGLFSEVMITIFRDDYRRDAFLKLKEWGIPVFQLGKNEDFYPAKTFVVDEAPSVSVQEEGYEYFVFCNLRGVVSWARSSGIMYLFDKTGKILEEHWDRYPIHDGLGIQYDYPIRLDHQPKHVIKMAGEYCVLTKRYSENYWHFTFEGMDCVHLLEENGFTGRYIINDQPCNKELLLLYGIDENRIITLRKLELGIVYEFERVCYPSLVHNYRCNSAKVLNRYSRFMKEKLVRDKNTFPSRLFVKRTGTRKLLNCENVLEKYGFVNIIPDTLTVKEQMEFFYNADIILSPHGANLTNSLYMREETVLIETFGRDWVFYNLIDTLRENKVYYLPVVKGGIIFPGQVVIGDPDQDTIIPEIHLVNAIDTAIFIRDSIEKGGNTIGAR